MRLGISVKKKYTNRRKKNKQTNIILIQTIQDAERTFGAKLNEWNKVGILFKLKNMYVHTGHSWRSKIIEHGKTRGIRKFKVKCRRSQRFVAGDWLESKILFRFERRYMCDKSYKKKKNHTKSKTKMRKNLLRPTTNQTPKENDQQAKKLLKSNRKIAGYVRTYTHTQYTHTHTHTHTHSKQL